MGHFTRSGMTGQLCGGEVSRYPFSNSSQWLCATHLVCVWGEGQGLGGSTVSLSPSPFILGTWCQNSLHSWSRKGPGVRVSPLKSTEGQKLAVQELHTGEALLPTAITGRVCCRVHKGLLMLWQNTKHTRALTHLRCHRSISRDM